MSFLVEFARSPRRTGAVMRSSRRVVASLLDGLDPSSARSVVELGAGDGAVTRVLRSRLVPGTTLIAVEINPVLARRLSRCCPDGAVEVVEGSASQLSTLLRQRGLATVDCVISGLPWTSMGAQERVDTVAAIARVLAEDGRFSLLLCRHMVESVAGRNLVDLLKEHFGIVRRERTVWSNVPPLTIYECAEPIRADRRAESGSQAR